jgi:hypothetical protein
MSPPAASSVLEAQAEALLQRVAEDRERRCAALQSAAEEQRRQILRAARADARRNVGSAASQERARLELGIRQAEARADIEARSQVQRASRELLERMWAAISHTLEQRWRDPKLRREWIAAALAQAAALVPGRAWVLECAGPCAELERAEHTVRALAQGARAVEWSLKTTMPAGLTIRAEGVCIDATIPGLLVSRASIEAAFLAELELHRRAQPYADS